MFPPRRGKPRYGGETDGNRWETDGKRTGIRRDKYLVLNFTQAFQCLGKRGGAVGTKGNGRELDEVRVYLGFPLGGETEVRTGNGRETHGKRTGNGRETDEKYAEMDGKWVADRKAIQGTCNEHARLLQLPI